MSLGPSGGGGGGSGWLLQALELEFVAHRKSKWQVGRASGGRVDASWAAASTKVAHRQPRQVHLTMKLQLRCAGRSRLES